ncbi:MAG TPA: hypothetical protein DCS66_19520 [Flavobacteriaceae bacterium]|nr:hypothetical protein [Flavobacteriaceae bacterium]
MNDMPKPSGYDVYWEKWIDAFEDEDESFSEAVSEAEQELTHEELLENEHLFHEVSHVRSIVTPFGILPLTEQTMASKHFKFWVGHSNFKLTKDFYTVIGQHPGIETLDILTPYRFRIAVGKMFTDRDVMIGVRDEMVQHVASAQPSGHIADTETNANQYEN